MSDSYPCPCCGHRVLDAMPGSYEICPVCFWEDDGVQSRWPTMAGGANQVSLIDAQRNWRVGTGRAYGVPGPGLGWELDWTAPWEHLVEESRTWSLLEASEAPAGDGIFVAPAWIDRSDLHPER
ncbi:hypothetical protein K6168_23930 [Streptomyces sp. FB2]|uniref:CPCC family cysteine-rich protein n=1 Tax=Streptomyces sp. FB2 TaxID=2902454 RepID=UPI001F3E6AE4|nr:CPCC family cysteine-rich protein [Streptomyces sp. FB2]MCF2538686.1 hypothetical protein [Streptomyces sp. FB2]